MRESVCKTVIYVRDNRLMEVKDLFTEWDRWKAPWKKQLRRQQAH